MSRQLKLINGQWCVSDSETGFETGKKSIQNISETPKEKEEPELFCSRIYLQKFVFDTTYRPIYPYNIVSEIGIRTLDLAPITILYGGNGSGKSTLLNIIADNIHITHKTQGNTNEYFSSYVKKCAHETNNSMPIPEDSEFLRSEDIMDHIVKDRKRYSSVRKVAMTKDTNLLPDMDGAEKTMMDQFLNDPDSLSSQDRFFLSRCSSGMNNALEASQISSMFESNGEVAISRIRDMIMPDCLYLLDEPENSLSPVFQKQLAHHIEMFSKGLRTQFIIATHSPFFLSMDGVRIYDLDSHPAQRKAWYELKNMQAYFNLFDTNRDKFNQTTNLEL